MKKNDEVMFELARLESRMLRRLERLAARIRYLEREVYRGNLPDELKKEPQKKETTP
jgi:hypothetical protein